MLPSSFMQTIRFWCNVVTYVINLCVDRVLSSLICLFSQLRLNRNEVKTTQINTQVDHMGCNIAPKPFRLREASR